MTTPQNRVAALVFGSSLKRVHFSPQNEEIPSGTTPQSSPTRARMRPQSRGILKRSAMEIPGSSNGSSDSEHYTERFRENGLLDSLSSLPSSPNNGALTGNVSAFPQRTAGGSEREPDNALLFEQTLDRLIDRLEQAEGESVPEAGAYNELCGLLAKHSNMAAEKHGRIMSLLDCIIRDVSNHATPRPAVLAAVKCLGCLLHIEQISAAAASSKRLCPLLEAVHKRVVAQHATDKVMCQAAVWCVGIMRAPAAAIQPAVSKLVELCVTVLSRLESSATIQYECLTAIEALLRRSPGATRQVFRQWLFPVLGCIVSPVPGVRTKADGIIRHNMPWIAADAHGADMDAPVKEFVALRLDRVLASATRLLARGDYVLVARIWGMVIAICARHCRSKINAMLKVIQECFNSPDSDVLVAALMQWRCLIYAFVLDNRIHTCKCVQLVLSPIVTILETPSTAAAVRLACVQCWATLVYALGEEIGAHIDVLSKVARMVGKDPSTDVRNVVARVLAAVFNKLVLPGEKVAQFIIPRMVIGTTTLAAADGKSLSNTRGPFSSDVLYTGDHTAILCNYVVGVGASSPTIPVIAEMAIEVIQQCITAQRCEECGSCGAALSNDASKHASFAGLCNAVAVAACALQENDKGVQTLPSRAQELAVALAELYLSTKPAYAKREARLCTTCPAQFAGSPRAVLFEAIHRNLFVLLSGCRLNLGSAAKPEVSGNAPTLPGPCEPTYTCALVDMHILNQFQLLYSSAGTKADVGAFVRLIQTVVTDPSTESDCEVVRVDCAVAAVTAISHALESTEVTKADSSICLAARDVLEYIVERLQVAPDSPHAPLLVKEVLRVHSLLPSGHGMMDVMFRVIRCSTAGIPKQVFWETAFGVVFGLETSDQFTVDSGGLALISEFLADYSVDVDSADCFAVVVLVISRFVHGLVAEPWEPAQELTRRMREITHGPGMLTLTAVVAASAIFMRQVVAVVRAQKAKITANQADDLRAALTLIADMPLSKINPQANTDLKSAIRGLIQTASDMVHELKQLSVRKRPGRQSSADTLPWAFTAVGEGALDFATVEQRKRTHSPASSDDESEPVSRCSSVASRSPESRVAGAANSAVPVQTPLRRSKRRKRSKRKSVLSQSASEGEAAGNSAQAQPAETDRTSGAERRLSGLLDQLETELQSASSCSLGPLLQAQARIAGIQQRLCEAMQEQANIE
ncbi:hypothetical protein GGF43_003077 [Coemansia sp. RSA 2618]|nr:hypothetical protein GGF43_003077 [Coemansia sp. RSA 2618]